MSNWIPIEQEQPKAMQRVYVVCENEYSGRVVQYQTMAEYIPYMTVPTEEYMHEDYTEEGDYDEENDIYYTIAGFYEYQFEADIHYYISAKVTHWMPLFEKPERKEAANV